MGLQLDAVEPGFLAPPSGVDEAVDHPGEVIVGRDVHGSRGGRGERPITLADSTG